MNHQSQEQHHPKTLQCHSDRSFPHPGEYLAVYCGVCGKNMTARRNVLGPTGFAEAMLVQSGQSQGHLHDEFLCEDREEPWHQQAKAIRDQARESPSQRLADLLTEEADEIVRTRKSTRQSW